MRLDQEQFQGLKEELQQQDLVKIFFYTLLGSTEKEKTLELLLVKKQVLIPELMKFTCNVIVLL